MLTTLHGFRWRSLPSRVSVFVVSVSQRPKSNSNTNSEIYTIHHKDECEQVLACNVRKGCYLCCCFCLCISLSLSVCVCEENVFFALVLTQHAHTNSIWLGKSAAAQIEESVLRRRRKPYFSLLQIVHNPVYVSSHTHQHLQKHQRLTLITRWFSRRLGSGHVLWSIGGRLLSSGCILAPEWLVVFNRDGLTMFIDSDTLFSLFLKYIFSISIVQLFGHCFHTDEWGFKKVSKWLLLKSIETNSNLPDNKISQKMRLEKNPNCVILE